ncbi:MAG: hypothetical protein IT287_09405 [Bdellovibrionaceae bacterium]|nr:hypothetical protein [Pseudobdellovibrionaceae bacterium]
MSKEIIRQLQSIENQIISGNLPEAKNHLLRIPNHKIPRDLVAKTAQLFRRVGAVESALQILLPLVRPKAQSSALASWEEIIEYAICLKRLGCTEEACEFLKSVPVEDAPEALLYKTLFRFSEWDYRGGVRQLLKVINSCPRDSYLNRLAQLHLASAFIAEEKFSEAEIVLSELRESSSLNGESFLFFNSLEISAKAAILMGSFKQAEQCLNEADVIAKSFKAFDAFWLLKWRSILNAFTNKDTSLLEPARREARANFHWEALRELDFYSCKIQRDENTYLKLFFGTAYPGYRRSLVRDFGEPNATNAFLSQNGVYSTQEQNSINVFKDFDGELSPGGAPHQLLLVLLTDTYRGLRTGQIHNYIFPEETYSPTESAERVEHVVHRLRKLMVAHLPGLQINHENEVYRLDFTHFKQVLKIPKNFPKLTSADIKLFALQERIKKEFYEADDVEDAFSISKAAASKLISSWRESGAIEAEGKAKPVKFNIKKIA